MGKGTIKGVLVYARESLMPMSWALVFREESPRVIAKELYGPPKTPS
jgi:hypothetical protein